MANIKGRSESTCFPPVFIGAKVIEASVPLQFFKKIYQGLLQYRHFKFIDDLVVFALRKPQELNF